MDGVATSPPSYADYFSDIEIAFAGGSCANRISFVGQAHVERFAVDLAKNGGGSNAEFPAGSKDADGDFAAIGDQDFLEHAIFAMRGNSSMQERQGWRARQVACPIVSGVRRCGEFVKRSAGAGCVDTG